MLKRAIILGCLIPAAVTVEPIRFPSAGSGVRIGVVTAGAQPRVLRWAGDPEGGAPFVEADPAHPDQVVGFDVEIAALLASEGSCGVRNVRFESISQRVARGDQTRLTYRGHPGAQLRRWRRCVLRVQRGLSVRDADSEVRSLADLRGRPSARSANEAYESASRRAQHPARGVVEDDVHLQDLVIGRVDAVARYVLASGA